MNEELKSLIEDAAKLLGFEGEPCVVGGEVKFISSFNPLDPERGYLWKVADAAELYINFRCKTVCWAIDNILNVECFPKGDHQSQALAVLRAASAVLKARGEE